MKHCRAYVLYISTVHVYLRMDATVESTDLHLISENEVKLFQIEPSNKGPLWIRWTHYVMKKGRKKP